jgi:hypothetical protein
MSLLLPVRVAMNSSERLNWLAQRLVIILQQNTIRFEEGYSSVSFLLHSTLVSYVLFLSLSVSFAMHRSLGRSRSKASFEKWYYVYSSSFFRFVISKERHLAAHPSISSMYRSKKKPSDRCLFFESSRRFRFSSMNTSISHSILIDYVIYRCGSPCWSFTFFSFSVQVTSFSTSRPREDFAFRFE